MRPTSSLSALARYIAAISRAHRLALAANSLILLLITVTSTIALERHSLYENISFVRSAQLIHFQQLGNATRSLMKASADRSVSDYVIRELVDDVDHGIEAVRSDADQLDALRNRLAGNALERLRHRASDDVAVDRQLDARIYVFLSRAQRVADVSTDIRRTSFAFWGQIDFAVAAEGTVMQEFQRVLRLSYGKSASSIAFARRTVGALAGFLFLIIAGESLFIFRPLLRKLRAEHRNKQGYEQRLAELALKDSLTGLDNRASFTQRLGELIAAHPLPGVGFALLFVDLDQFKAVNDTLGHLAGDAVLRHVAAQLRAALRPGDVIARLGGDEFAVLLPTVDDGARLHSVAARIAASLGAALDYEARALTVTASIGGALFPSHGGTAAVLMRCADLALHAAKARRNVVVVYDPAMMADTQARSALKAALPAAIERGEFVPFYQPKVDILTGAHLGFEALVRWRHPAEGLLPPARFLSLLDTPALAEGMTEAMIQAVARDLAAWRQAGLTPGPVAVNISEAILAGDAGYQMFERAIGQHGVGWADFAVEITEDVFLNRRADQISERVARLHRHGVQIALDDFGTGFASLTHLRAFAFDEIKIDRSFTADLGRDARAEQIVKAMIDLARNLGKRVVAEGIETGAQRDFLIAAGCRIGQGYLFSKPVPFDQATALIGSAPALAPAGAVHP